MATHSSVLAWRIPGMAEPGGLPSMGLHRVGHDWSDLAAAAAAAAAGVWLYQGMVTISDFYELQFAYKKNPGFPGGSVVESLPMQETQVQSLDQENPTYCGALGLCTIITESVLCSPEAATSECTCHSYWSPRALAPVLWKKSSHRSGGPMQHSWRVDPALHN